MYTGFILFWIVLVFGGATVLLLLTARLRRMADEDYPAERIPAVLRRCRRERLHFYSHLVEWATIVLIVLLAIWAVGKVSTK
jgi:hypothetical protein